MTKNLLRAGALSCALLASTALTAPAMAQSAPPPMNHNIDPNGVDVVLGRFDMSQALVSIGPDWPHGLRYVRIRDDSHWTDSHSGDLFQDFNQIWVSVGGTSVKFIYSGGANLFSAGSFTPDRADGSTLTRSGGAFTYTDRNGLVTRLTAEIASNGRIVAGTGRLMDMRYPNGAVVTFNYRLEQICDQEEVCRSVTRRQSITNNFGYQLHFGYADNAVPSEESEAEWRRITSVRAINTTVESCNPTADSCTLTGAWPVATIGVAGGHETVTLPDGNAWRFTPDAGPLTGVRRPGSTSDDVTISYGSGTMSVTGLAGTWNYAFSDSGATRTTTVSGPLSGARTVVSDTERQIVTSDQDALGRTTTYQYDGEDRLTRVTAPEGNYRQLTYDGRGNVTESRAVAKSGSGLADIVETAAYPSTCANPVTCNLPTSATDARGNVIDFTYDSTHGGLLSITGPAPTTGAVRPQTRFGYTSATVGGQTVRLPATVSACQTLSSCAGTADEVVTGTSYGGANFLPVSVSSGNGSGTLTATSAAAYDDIGNPITVDGPLSGTADTTRLRYNALRQVVGAISPDPDGAGALKHRATRVTYDAAGLESASETGTVSGQSDGDWAAMTVLQRAETDRDALGRPVAQRLIAGAATHALSQISYDARGRPECTTQRMNPAEFASPPASACTQDTPGSFGPDRIARTTYDAAGQVTKVETGYGVSGVAADEVTVTYSANGRVATLTDANGNRTGYAYDGFDRVSRTYMPSATTPGTISTTDYEELTYDAAGNVTSRRLRDGDSIGYSYDALNRLTAKDLPATAWYNLDRVYSYDNLGRLLSADGNSLFQYAYDGLGRLAYENTPFGAVSHQYDAAGRRTRLTYTDGFYVAYDLQVTGEVSAIRENGASSGAGVLATYAYDDLGRRTSLTRGNGTVTSYSYDAVSRLSGLTQNLNGSGSDVTFGYAYNPASEIVSNTRSNDAYSFTLANANVTSSADGLNRLSSIAGSSIGYDARGNVSSVPAAGSVTGTARNFEYNADNALVVATDSSGGRQEMMPDSVERLHRYYDGVANRWLIYDGRQLIAETNSSATAIARRYVHGPGTDEPLVWYEGSGTSDRRWLHADERGSVIAASDGSGDVINGPNRYDEFGLPQGGSLTGRFGYTGQAWLPAPGLYDYRARFYNPAMGRFMQTDPIGYDGGMNLYAYVGNNPVNFTDPLGLDDVTVTGNPCTGCHGSGDSSVGPFWNIINWGSSPTLLQGKYLAAPCYDSYCEHNATVNYQRPTRALPGGYVTGAQACLRSCHGVGTPFHMRYLTEEETDELINLTIDIASIVPALRWLRFWRRGCGCLVAGTLVATPEGSRPIEQIKVGDLVLAMNEDTGEIAPQRVTELIRPEPKPVFALALRNPRGEIEIFNATDDHPWRTQAGAWVETTDLQVGDRIDTASNDDLTVVSLTRTGRVEATFNLTVDRWHTFLVGADRVVVHNACSPNQLNRAIQKGKAPAGIESVHQPHVPGDRVHAHINGGALNRNGTWRHEPNSPITNSQRAWLEGHGWTVP